MRTQIILAALPFLITACSTYYYMPTASNVPLFKKEKEVQIKGGVDEVASNAQIGYAVNKHIGLIANGVWNKNEYGLDHYLIECGGGYYSRFLKYGLFELFAGYGQGEIHIGQPDYERKINRLFFQPSIGFSSDFFDAAITPKFSSVQFYKQHTDVYYIDEPINDIRYLFFEPCVTLRAGYKWVKLQLQYSTTDMKYGIDFPYVNSNFSLMVLLTVPLAK